MRDVRHQVSSHSYNLNHSYTKLLGSLTAGEHLEENISAVYNGLDVSFSSFPSDSTTYDPEAYKAAIDALAPGDAITIFTPDTTHYPIALYAIEHDLHILITKLK